MSRTQKAFSAEANRDRIGMVLERKRSGAAGPHGSRNTRRARTRSAALRRELKTQGAY